MRLRELRDELASYARRLEQDGLTEGTAGNISVRAGKLIAITPSSVPYAEVDAAAIAVVTEDGTQVDGFFPPSSELPMHLAVYDGTSAGAVVHTHSPFATAVATTLDALPTIHYLSADLGGEVPVVPYERFGSQALARRVATALDGRNAALLQSHGAVAIGADIRSAYDHARLLEWLAALYCRSRSIGRPVTIPGEEIRHVAARLRHTRRKASRCAALNAAEGGAGGR